MQWIATSTWITTAQIILISFSIIYTAAVIYRSVKKEACFYLLWVHVFPLSQYIALNCIRHIDFAKMFPFLPVLIMCGIFLGIFSDIILALYMLRTEKNKNILSHLEELEYTRKLNQQHYELVMKNEKETLEMCKDYLGQLDEAEKILSGNDQKQLADLKETLNETIRRRKADHFCQNIIVDALMHEKKLLCRKNQIELTANIQLSESCPIAPLHLCSLFSNLMDNAIHACAELPEKQTRYIQIKTEYIQGYLCINEKNPYSKLRSRLNPRKNHHGYGLQILNDICEQYNGTMKIQKQAGIFDTTLFLQISDNRNQEVSLP